MAFDNNNDSAIEMVLPWITFLSPTDREACIRELRDVGAASHESGRLSRLAETLYAWEASALASWDERRNRERLDHLSEAPVDIPRPTW